MNSSFCQTNLSNQTLINYRTLLNNNLKHQQFISNGITLNHTQLDIRSINSLTNDFYLTTNSKQTEHCSNNNEQNQLNKNFQLINESKNDQSIQSKDVDLKEKINDYQTNNVQAISDQNSNEPIDQQAPKKTQRKNTGRYIKRASSSTADSLAARRYRCSNLKSNTTPREQQQEQHISNKNVNNSKQLSKSCTELAKQSEADENQSDFSKRCTSEKNLNQNSKPHSNDANLDDENFDKSASLPKFKSLNRLISKLKRSHTIHNVDDLVDDIGTIRKRSSSLFIYPSGSNSLKSKNQYFLKSNTLSNTLWKRSSAVGHQIYQKTLNLSKLSLFKRQSVNINDIPICKLKGICSFCCKKM